MLEHTVFVDSAMCSIICKEGKGGIASQFSAFELGRPRACGTHVILRVPSASLPGRKR